MTSRSISVGLMPRMTDCTLTIAQVAKWRILLAVAFLAGGEEVLRHRVPAVAARPDVLARVDLVVGRARREIQRIAAEVTVSMVVLCPPAGVTRSPLRNLPIGYFHRLEGKAHKFVQVVFGDQEMVI